MKKLRFAGSVLLVCLMIFSLLGNAISTEVKAEPVPKSSSSGLTEHEPIYIDGNENFSAENGVVRGSGTESDPYIIEGWDINASTTHGIKHGIKIDNTDVYFIIRNCVVHDGYESGVRSNDGIYFHDVQNGIIDNVTFYNNYNGIRLAFSSNNNLSANQIYSNYDDGIYLWYSSNNKISANKIYNNGDDGIELYESSNNNLSANQIYSNYHDGIYLWYSSNNNISANQIYNNSGYGIHLYRTPNNNITGNTFTNDGIVMYGNLDECIQTIESNTVNGKLLGYFLNEDGITLESIEIGQLILVNCTNFIIKNLDISCIEVGIQLLYSSNNQIINCAVYNNFCNPDRWGCWGVGIALKHSSNNQVHNCMCYNNSHFGISLGGSQNNQITNCAFWRNSFGIDLSFSSNNTIIHCTSYNNFKGDEPPCWSTHGYVFYKNSFGIYLSYSSDNIIMYSAFYNNSYGFFLSKSSDNILSYNRIYNNYYGSIRAGASSGNKVRHNNFYNNGGGIHNLNSELEYIVDATYNWWGSPDGPGGIGSGRGDNISENVLYNPWLVTPLSFPLPHLPIYINTNSNFTGANGVVSGSGTKEDPYIIENWGIVASLAHAINVRDTTAYLTIRNCVTFYGKSRTKHGIYLYNVTHITIENVTSYNNRRGISMFYSSNIKISNSTWYNNSEDGIMLSFSSNNLITSSACYNNGGGIYMDYSSSNNVINGTCYDNKYGIYLYNSSNVQAHRMNIYNNTDYGIYNENLDPKYEMNATMCWWGASNGPRGVGTGDGDRISANVLYDSWLTEKFNREPIADFSYLPSFPVSLDTVYLIDESYDQDVWGGIVSWYWEFGDGNMSREQNPTHIYSSPGEYVVKLIVTDNDHAVSNVTKTIVIYSDFDSDGIADVIDDDDDNDGYSDDVDAFPLDPTEWLDTDNDGIGDNADTDDDNDGLPDNWEETYGLNPKSASDASFDNDGDGYTNLQEYQNGTDPTDATSHPMKEEMPKLATRHIILIVGVIAVAVIVSVIILRRKKVKT